MIYTTWQWHVQLLCWPRLPCSSSSSLPCMSGVRRNYVVAIIFVNGGVISSVTWQHDMMVVIFYLNNDNQPWFWRGSISPRPPDPYTNRKLVKRGICSIFRKSCCEGCGKSYNRSTKIDENRNCFVTKGGASGLVYWYQYLTQGAKSTPLSLLSSSGKKIDVKYKKKFQWLAATLFHVPLLYTLHTTLFDVTSRKIQICLQLTIFHLPPFSM